MIERKFQVARKFGLRLDRYCAASDPDNSPTRPTPRTLNARSRQSKQCNQSHCGADAYISIHVRFLTNARLSTINGARTRVTLPQSGRVLPLICSKGIARDVNTAGLALIFDTRRNVNTITEDVVAVDNDSPTLIPMRNLIRGSAPLALRSAICK